MQSKVNRDAARKTLIDRDWFLPEEKIKLTTLLGLNTNDFELPTQAMSVEVANSGIKQGRDIKFRLQVVPLYRYACALCRIKMLLPSGVALVEAAHIHQFAQSRNDDITNGMALCRNHHWAFDQGLWSIDTSFEVVVARGKFAEQVKNQPELMSYHLKQLDLSWLEPKHRPSQLNLDWHRKNKFMGELNLTGGLLRT